MYLDSGLKYNVFETSHGWLGVLGTNLGLSRIILPEPSFQQAFNALGKPMDNAVLAPEVFSDFQHKVAAFFKGKSVTFNEPLDLSTASPFQRRVLAATSLIPYGETRTYGWIANTIEKPGSSRAVGTALSKNPLPIVVPCHRVIGSDGDLCGFGGGLKMKRSLLELEGIKV